MSRAVPRRLRASLPEWLSWTLGLSAAISLLLVAGWSIPTEPYVAVVVVTVILALGLTLAEPALIPLVAMPALLVIVRLNLGPVDLSVSDLALTFAFLPAVLLAERPFSPQLRSLLWLSAIYQGATLFTVIANPYPENTVEWFHTWVLVSGSLVVGWAVARRGYAAAALSLLLLTCGLLAAVTLGQTVQQYQTGDFGAVYLTWPYAMHKNFAGMVLGFGALVAYVHPAWMGWSKRWSLALFWLCTLGVLATQSRQALVALGVTLVVMMVRTDSGRLRSKGIVFAVVPFLALAAVTLKSQFESGNRFNSAFQRVTSSQDALDIWAQSPVYGVGLRWWYTDRFPGLSQPPNGELEVLSSAGLIGLTGFLVLLLGTLFVVWRVDPRYGNVAAAVVLSRIVQTQFDFFWSAVGGSLLFVTAGICLGAQALAVDREQLEESLRPHVEEAGAVR